MGLFGEKLLLNLHATSMPSGKPRLQIKKTNHLSPHLLPFSSISLISSQLTVLTYNHPQSLCESVLKFIESPKIQYYSTKLVSGFNLEIYRGRGKSYFNQFDPHFTGMIKPHNNDALETEIEYLLMNYLNLVFDESYKNEQVKLRAFLLIAVSFYQQELIPIIKRMDLNNLQQRRMLASDQINFSSSIYHRWDSSIPFAPENELFCQHLYAALKFNSY